jgi:hypothetical protein
MAARSTGSAFEKFQRERTLDGERIADLIRLPPKCVSCYGDGMNDSALLDELLDPFTYCLDAESAQRVADFRIAPSVQERVAALAEGANEGVLTEEERTEYEALMNAADFIAILKLKVRRRLTSTVDR